MPIWLTAMMTANATIAISAIRPSNRAVGEAHLSGSDLDGIAHEAGDDRGDEQDDRGDDQVRDPQQDLVEQGADLGQAEDIRSGHQEDDPNEPLDELAADDARLDLSALVAIDVTTVLGEEAVGAGAAQEPGHDPRQDPGDDPADDDDDQGADDQRDRGEEAVEGVGQRQEDRISPGGDLDWWASDRSFVDGRGRDRG